MLTPSELRNAIKSDHRKISEIADLSGVARPTIYSFISGDSKSLRAEAHALVEQIVIPRPTKAMREKAAVFEDDTDYVKAARQLGLDPEAIAAKAVEDAVKRKRIEKWNAENREAIESWNDLVKKEGLWSDGLRAF